ncbi:MAG: hypothetical protein WD942_11020 [Dehalococcoidia bacterium]
MTEPAVREVKVSLGGGRCLVLRLLDDDRIQLVVAGASLMTLSRLQAWEVAEALDAIASGP